MRFDPDDGEFRPRPLFTDGSPYLNHPGCRPRVVALLLSLEASNPYDERTWRKKNELAFEELTPEDWADLETLRPADLAAVADGFSHRLRVVAEVHWWQAARYRSGGIETIDASLSAVRGPAPISTRAAQLRVRYMGVGERLRHLCEKETDSPDGSLVGEDAVEFRRLEAELNRITDELDELRSEGESGL